MLAVTGTLTMTGESQHGVGLSPALISALQTHTLRTGIQQWPTGPGAMRLFWAACSGGEGFGLQSQLHAHYNRFGVVAA